VNIEPTNWLTTQIVMFLARITPKCHDMTRLISQDLDCPLPWTTRVKLRMHFWICVWCLRYGDQVGFIDKALHIRPEEPVTPDAAGLPAEAKRSPQACVAGNRVAIKRKSFQFRATNT
jgi:hypothetical protein